MKAPDWNGSRVAGRRKVPSGKMAKDSPPWIRSIISRVASAAARTEPRLTKLAPMRFTIVPT